MRLIGQKETLKLLLSCRRVNSKEAEKMGLCDLITYGEGDRATRETLLWLEEKYLGHISGNVLKSMKSICVRPCQSIEDNLEHEKGHFCNHWGGQSFAKSINKKKLNINQ